MDALASALQPRIQARRWTDRVTPVHAALLLALAALALRTIGISARPLWLDEAYSAWFSTRGWVELWTVVPTYETHPPLYYSLLKLWRALFDGSAAALRSASIIFGVATVPVVMACALQLDKASPERVRLRAAVAGLLVACSPVLVRFDQEARPYPLLTFAFAVGILGLLRLMREFPEGGAGKIRSWLILGFGTELLLWSHGLAPLYGMCLALALLPAWLKRPVPRTRIVRGVTAAAAIGLLYVPCLLMMAQRVGDWADGWLRWSADMPLQLLALYFAPFDGSNILQALALAVALVLAIRAVMKAASSRGWDADRALLLLWAGPPLLTILISAFYAPIFLPRTLTATVVPAYLVLAGAVARSSRWEQLIMPVVLAIAWVPSALQTATRPPAERWGEVSVYLKGHVQPSDQVWFYPNDSELPLRAAGFGPSSNARGVPGSYPLIGVNGIVRGGSPAVVSLTHSQAEALANGPATAGAGTIWLVTRQSDVFDPQQDLPKALARVRRAGPKRSWSAIGVQPYFPQPH